MPTTVYRVSRAIHPLFDGTGALRFGARWTSPGRSAVYTAGSYAGALLEVLAHGRRLSMKEPYHAMKIEIPDDVPITLISATGNIGWYASDYAVSRAIGDEWLDKGVTAVLRTPSVTGRPHEVNLVINPAHRDAHRLVLSEPHQVVWDGRLLGV